MIRTIAATAALMVAAGTASAATLLSENFDDEAADFGTQLDFDDFDDFDVRHGTVDLIAMPNQYDISCAGGAGGCVDLNGSTGNNGLLFTALDLEANQTYELSFSLSGNQRDSNGSGDKCRSVQGFQRVDISVARTWLAWFGV